MESEGLNVLLAEDDKNLGTILKAYLEAKGYPTTLCVNGKEAFDMYNRKKFEFCILDIMMPIKDGFTLAQEIRKSDKNIPILFLTAKSMQADKLKGFELGADDYLTKPFSMEELLARMQAIIRRSEDPKKNTYQSAVFSIGKLNFDYNRHILSSENGEEKLTSKEAELLRLLCENMNEVLDRSLALNRIWQDDSYFNARSMDVHHKTKKIPESRPECRTDQCAWNRV